MGDLIPLSADGRRLSCGVKPTVWHGWTTIVSSNDEKELGELWWFPGTASPAMELSLCFFSSFGTD